MVGIAPRWVLQALNGAKTLTLYLNSHHLSNPRPTTRCRGRCLRGALDRPPSEPRLCRRRNLRIARLGRTGPSPWPSCGSHRVLGEGSEGGRSPPSEFSQPACATASSSSVPWPSPSATGTSATTSGG